MPDLRSSKRLQGQFEFGAAGQEAGYSRWLAGRHLATEAMARRLNLPLGHTVDLWLRGNVRVTGKLRLKEDVLVIDEEAVRHLELRVDRLVFRVGEIESCVRLD